MISKWGFMSKSYNNILYYIKVANGMSVLSYVVTQISISRLDFYSRNKLQTYLVKSLTSEATPLATQFYKRSYIIRHPPQL